MQTSLQSSVLATTRGREADAELRRCVHCGFCNATCPTYALLGDELDGPRGRIYLIKQALEGGPVSRRTQLHLDRCLTCQACETTCPSGVDYHKLLSLGRAVVAERVGRPIGSRLRRAMLLQLVLSRRLFECLCGVARLLRGWLPGRLRRRVGIRAPEQAARTVGTRQMIALRGCVQPGLAPNINQASARVLRRLGIQLVEMPDQCCGALSYHLDDQADGLNRARHNIDTWWPAIESGAEAVVVTASGCGVFVKQYGELLAQDRDYAERASKVAALTRDPIEILAGHELPVETRSARVSFQSPCTLQHGQKLDGAVEAYLTALGFDLCQVADAHMCCGSAGVYSLLHPDIAGQLRANKLRALHSGQPEVIATGNIGCLGHLAAATDTPVKHWIELIDESLQPE